MTSPNDSMGRAYASENSRSMIWLLGQFLMVPVNAFLYGMNMMLRTMQGMQQVTSQGVEVMVGPNTLLATPDAKNVSETQLSVSKIVNTDTGNNVVTNKEETKLNGNGPKIDPNQAFCSPNTQTVAVVNATASAPCLILWRYKVLFIKRDLEHAFPEAEDLVPNDVTDITAWKIAEFIQQLGQCKVEVPRKWLERRYPNPKKYWRLDCDDENGEIEDIEEACSGKTRIYLIGLPEDDKKFLRLYSQQLASYTRQDPKYEERQIEVLEQIRDRIRQS
jgi:hypothetical protein